MPPEPHRDAAAQPARGAGRVDRRTEEHERFGPLELTRVHKDDGRELIFFPDTREPA